MNKSKKKLIFIQTTGAWWDHRYYFKQMPALCETADVSYLIREDETFKKDKNIKFDVIQISKKKADWARKTGGVNLLIKLMKMSPDGIQLCNIELLPLGILLALFTKSKVFYDCREDHFHAMLHSKVWFPIWLRYILAYGVKFLEFFASKTFTGFVDSDPAIYNFHKYISKNKKMIFYNMALKSQFNLVDRNDNKEFFFCVLGSMSIRTGVLDVVKAFSVINQLGYDCKLKLIGNPHFDKILSKSINDVISSKNLSNMIKITGKVPYHKVPFELAECKVGIIPLLNIPKFQNNIATKQFEYMSSEMAIISSDLAPQRLFINENENGLFYEAGNVNDLVKKMIYLLDNPLKIKDFSSRSKQLTETKWNAEQQQQKICKFYGLRLNNKSYTETQLPPFS